jgi:neuraminyllactose-binding hemagglutinin
MERTLIDVINKKGFTTKGAYKDEADLTYTDKRAAYIMIVPALSLGVKATEIRKDPKTYHVAERGVFVVEGDIRLNIIEPLTGQTIGSERINFADVKVSRSYIYERQTKQTVESDDVPAYLTDNTDKAIADLLNEFYPKAVDKIVRYLSREKLLSYEKEIADLKAQKRY